MTHEYKPRGVCAQKIIFELSENNTLTNVQVLGGCQGNLSGIAKLVEGLPAEEVVKKLKGLRCGLRKSSCPDQLASALEEAIAAKI